MKALYDQLSLKCSRAITHLYSTSFSLGILCLHRRLQDPIHGIYGFVRLADEIVDSFHHYNKHALLARFRHDTDAAIEDRISLNPILNSFQEIVHRYAIDRQLIHAFLDSMELDLHRNRYDEAAFDRYVMGSAECVGLMCLRVFSEGDHQMYSQLQEPARRLGAAFQKVNFLRDLNADMLELGRSYFPGIEFFRLSKSQKDTIEKTIMQDFHEALKGIQRLPRSSRFGVYVAYMYYLALFNKIRDTPAEKVLKTRIRIPNRHKASLLALSYVRHRLNLL